MANLSSARSMQTVVKVGYQQLGLTDLYTEGFLYQTPNQIEGGS
jgi:hypothetical protein